MVIVVPMVGATTVSVAVVVLVTLLVVLVVECDGDVAGLVAGEKRKRGESHSGVKLPRNED